MIQEHGEEFGKEIFTWLNQGKLYVPVQRNKDLIVYGESLGLNATQIREALKSALLQFDLGKWEMMTQAVVAYQNVK